MNESDRADLKAAARILTSQGWLSAKEADRIAATLIRVAGVPSLREEFAAMPGVPLSVIAAVITPPPPTVISATPKQEAVTAAVVASGETEAQRKEVCAAWNDLPDSLKAHPGLKRLYRALGGINRDVPAFDPDKRNETSYPEGLSTIPRVADHLEDGGKA